MARVFLSDPATRKQFTPQGAEALTQLVKQADISATGKRVQLAVSLTPGILDGLAAPPLRRTCQSREGARSRTKAGALTFRSLNEF